MSGESERMMAKVKAAVETYQHEKDGETPPIHMREIRLMETLRRIAKGGMKKSEMRERAASAMESWDESTRMFKTGYTDESKIDNLLGDDDDQ